jgi:hypothetical protein
MKQSAAVKDTLSTPSVNAGKPVNQWVGLSDQKATPVGRPTTDLARVAGMVSRGTARPGQVQAAQMMSTAANQERGVAALEKAFSAKDTPPTPTPLATAASAMGVAAPAAPAAPTTPTAPAAPAVIGDQFGSAASNKLMPTVGTINPPLQKKPNTLNALQMGLNSFAPSY